MLSSRPLVCIALAFAVGISLAAYSVPCVGVVLSVTLLLAVCFALTRRTLWGSLLFACTFVLFGAGRYLLATLLATTDVSHSAPAYVTLIGTVDSEVRATSGTRPGYPANGQFTLNTRGIVLQNDVQNAAQDDSGGSTQENGRRNVQEQNGQTSADEAGGFGTRVIAVSGQVQARIPLAPVLPMRGPASRNRQQSRQGQFDSSALPQASQGEIPPTPEPDMPHYGDALLLRGRLERPVSARNPGDFDYAAYLRRRGIYATITARRYADWKRVTDAQTLSELQNPPMTVALRLRESILRHGKRSHDTERGAVLNGILLGDRGDLPPALNVDFERTGTSHILATAGLHVGMVVVLLLGCLRFARFAHKPALLTAMALLVLYALMAGGRPSVVRAALMASVVLFGLLLEREPDLPNTLALAGFILLAYNPQNLFEPGFQLSFATVTTLVMLMPLARERIADAGKNILDHWPGASRLRKGIQTLYACFFLALTAQLGAMPLVAYYFNSVSLIGIVANTLVVPVIALIIPLGFGAALLGSLTALFAWPSDRLLDVLLEWVIQIVRVCSHAPYASVPVSSPPVWMICAYYTVLWSVAWHWQRTPRQSKSAPESPLEEPE